MRYLKEGLNVILPNSSDSSSQNSDEIESENLLKKQEMTNFHQEWNICVDEYNIARHSEENGFYNDKSPIAQIINYNDSISHYKTSYECFLIIKIPLVSFYGVISGLRQDYMQLTNISKQLVQTMKQASEYERDGYLSQVLELYPELSNLNNKRDPFTQSVKTKEHNYSNKVLEYYKELGF